MINWLYYKYKLKRKWINTKISKIYWNIILTLGWGLKIIPGSYCIKCQDYIGNYLSNLTFADKYTKFDNLMMKWYSFNFYKL